MSAIALSPPLDYPESDGRLLAACAAAALSSLRASLHVVR